METQPLKRTYQIDHSFNVPAVSELAHRERSAFKPVYSMNRWWARRSSIVFRAILMGLLSSDDEASVEQLYANANEAYPEAADQIILDPFMGGGTTVIEALRIGFRAVGVDLNPLSWFIVRTASAPVDVEKLESGYHRVERAVAPKIARLYTTKCPSCLEPAQVVHAFWAKLALCATCQERVEIRRNRIIGRRRGDVTIPSQDVRCPACSTQFDAELVEASLTYGPPASAKGGDQTEELCSQQSATRGIICPKCAWTFRVDASSGRVTEKRVQLYAVQCPTCQMCSTVRGPIPEKVECRHCRVPFDLQASNTARGLFFCSRGHASSIASAARASGSPLPFRLYAIEGYCPACAGTSYQGRLVGGRFFKTPDESDLSLYDHAVASWREAKGRLPYPTARIRDYEKTNRLIVHAYQYWHQLFNDRQLLALGWILESILQEDEPAVREALIAAFLATLEHHNMLNIYYLPYAQSAGAFGRHDFHPKVDVCEGNPWGSEKGRGTFQLSYRTVRVGKEYLRQPSESDYSSGRRVRVETGESAAPSFVKTVEELRVVRSGLLLANGDSRNLSFLPSGSVDHIVTDPPYADAVQYSELADFFYVWLREALPHEHHPMFDPDESPKREELVQNAARGQSQAHFHEGLTSVFRECHRVLKDSGRLVFTFHHSKRSHWEDLHFALLSSGFELLTSYPVASEGTRSGNLVFHSNRKSIAYDIVHVCSKVHDESSPKPVHWADANVEIRERVASMIDDILAHSHHGQRVSAQDVTVMVWGDILRLYSRHRGWVLSEEGSRMPLHSALQDATELIQSLCKAFGGRVLRT